MHRCIARTEEPWRCLRGPDLGPVGGQQAYSLAVPQAQLREDRDETGDLVFCFPVADCPISLTEGDALRETAQCAHDQLAMCGRRCAVALHGCPFGIESARFAVAASLRVRPWLSPERLWPRGCSVALNQRNGGWHVSPKFWAVELHLPPTGKGQEGCPP